MKYDVFDRLNTGGVIAEPMEIRNAVFQGGFNKLIRTLAELPTFRRLWDIPTEQADLEKNGLYRKMSDVELVLRFFALSHYDKMDMKFKDYLGDFMDSATRNMSKIRRSSRKIVTSSSERSTTVGQCSAVRPSGRDAQPKSPLL